MAVAPGGPDRPARVVDRRPPVLGRSAMGASRHVPTNAVLDFRCPRRAAVAADAVPCHRGSHGL